MDTQTLASHPAAPAPAVGMGATQFYPQDRYPYVVVEASRTGHAIWVRPLECVSTRTGHAPAGSCNGFPVWDHEYTDAELEALVQEGRLRRGSEDRTRPPPTSGAA